jgi:hypothetical protein
MGIPQRRIEGKHPITSQVDDSRDASITPTDIGITNVDGGSLYDGRVAGTSLRFGPFRNAQDFHKHLRVAWSSILTFTPRLTNSLLSMRNLTHRLFTHGDLSSLNILACGDKVVGIVDWETAG